MAMRQNVLKVHNFTTKAARQQTNTCQRTLNKTIRWTGLQGWARNRNKDFPTFLVISEFVSFSVNESAGKKVWSAEG